MKTILHRLTASVLMVCFLLSCSVSVSAFSFTVGETITNIGTIVTNTSDTVVEGFEYNKTTYTDKKNYGQTLYTMEFNPSEIDYVPVMYQPKPSYGSQVKDTVAAAEAEGYEVLAAINGEFGSMNTDNWGTLDGILISNGEIVADSEDVNEMCLAFGNDGSFQLVKSEMAYHFYIEGKEVLNAENNEAVIGCINKRYVGTNWWNPFCYFDYHTGGTTYTNSSVPGVEVVFEKVPGTALTVEGVLQGTVVSVNKDAYATAMSENQFVLYAQNGSANYDALANLKVGQECQIYAEELNDDAKEIMRNASSVTSATYPIVLDGADNTNNTPNAGDIYATRAQRTAIGVKADGTYVLVVTEGRAVTGDYDKGVTLPELAKMMIALGCQYAVNLDGGGSSTVYVDGKTTFTSGRAVSSSVLICKRNEATASPSSKATLEALVSEATATAFPAAQQANVDAAVKEANLALSNKNAMTSDYLRATMKLMLATEKVQSVSPKDFISLKASDWTDTASLMKLENDADGALILSNTNSQWPSATYTCNIPVTEDLKLYYDITVAGQTSILLTVNDQSVNINRLIAPDSCDPTSDDIIGNGKTFKGTLDVSQIASAPFNVTGLKVFAVGGAGAGSKVTVRDLAFRNPFSGGDINGDGAVNSSDARLTLRYSVGKQTLADNQLAAADLTGDGKVDTADVRAILKKRVAL